ncbi:NAD-dependent epimerase/dehydratase family protein [Thermobifida halotolerans]|uniref:NAD-dependent epimerase/dehydratase family protein n=1 Tax=Thermobifida halotolerans TaxID=483545 RepID=A0AA97LUS8_9ACTN|nr:NAD-dependent epimerase/dehydratase family protein [Thermobifida halotolerans]UOE18447.1 NAD-dependent epimerase/dehydratase family protein [Thermobifida halotolerans]
MARVVLVTGVSGYLGARVATALQDHPDVERVIGVDSAAPEHPLGRTEFVRAGLHGGGVAAAVRDSGADTVLHLRLAVAPQTAGRARTAENNVLGTMQLLEACQRSSSVRRLVVRSTAAVYGCAHEPRQEVPDAERIRVRRTARPRELTEAAVSERYVRGLGRRRPDLSIAVLRLADLMGPSVESPLTQYLERRLVPVLRGHDPRMQFLHEEDGVEVIRRMALTDRDGVFDVAAPDAIPLSQCLRRAGRSMMLPVPEPGLRVLGSLAGRRRLDYSPERLRQLDSGRLLDCSAVQRALDWSPTYTSQEAFDSYVAGCAVSRTVPARRRRRPLRRA